MEIQVHFDSRIPLQQQIAQQVMKMIQSEQLKPGDQLPTTRELAVKLGLNFNTVARAYRQLDQLGIISTQPGRGTFILDPTARKSSRKSRDKKIEELVHNFFNQAVYLGFEPEEILASLDKLVTKLEESA